MMARINAIQTSNHWLAHEALEKEIHFNYQQKRPYSFQNLEEQAATNYR